MPELPEVEMFKKYGEKHFLNRIIKKVEIDDTRIITVAKKAFENLEGRQLKSLHRRGKYVYGPTSKKDLFLIMHFGMTGYLKAYETKKDRPNGTRVDFELEDGFMAWVNPRKFGRVSLTDNADHYFKEKNLAEDALSISKEKFIENLTPTKGPIKSRLMDQKNVAGVGNIYADEILFQCEIHPETDVKKLSEKTLGDIHTAMQRIFGVAIRHEADYSTYPKHYLLYNRSEKRQDPPLSRIKVGGRTTFFDPKKQKKK